MKVLDINSNVINKEKIIFESFDDRYRDYCPYFTEGQNRTIVILIEKNDEKGYIKNIFKVILELDSSWFIYPRSIFNDFIVMQNIYQNNILQFDEDEYEILSESLYIYLSKLRNVGDDIFLINQNNDIVVSISHHINDEGIEIGFSNKNKSQELLELCNEISCQLELYSNGK